MGQKPVPLFSRYQSSRQFGTFRSVSALQPTESTQALACSHGSPAAATSFALEWISRPTINHFSQRILIRVLVGGGLSPINLLCPFFITDSFRLP